MVICFWPLYSKNLLGDCLKLKKNNRPRVCFVFSNDDTRDQNTRIPIVSGYGYLRVFLWLAMVYFISITNDPGLSLLIQYVKTNGSRLSGKENFSNPSVYYLHI